MTAAYRSDGAIPQGQSNESRSIRSCSHLKLCALFVSNAMPEPSAPRATFSPALHCNGIYSRFRSFQFCVTCRCPPLNSVIKFFKPLQKLAVRDTVGDVMAATFGTDEPYEAATCKSHVA